MKLINTCFLMVIVIVMLNSCTTISFKYKSEEGESDKWIYLDKDKVRGVGMYVHVYNEELLANIYFYSPFDELNEYKEIDAAIEGSGWQSDSVTFELEKPDRTKYYFEGRNFKELKAQLLTKENRPDSGKVYLNGFRRYSYQELPEKVQVKYSVVTADTTLRGVVSFIKTEVETESVMRWH
jgi:hypothetical protein